jgi:tRNA threonylcarbamoyladenosine biosynthesis protein TsaE
MHSKTVARPSRTAFDASRDSQMSTKNPRSSPGIWKVMLTSRSATESLGKILGRCLEGGEVLALCGELGAGKTALVRGIAAGLGAPPTAVSSPTFVLIHEYQGRLPLIHVDLYRLRSETDAAATGIMEYFDGTAVTAIEWADRFPLLLPDDRLEIRLTHRSPATRKARLAAHGPHSLALLSRIKQAHRPIRRSRPLRQAKPASRRKALKR